MFCVTFSLKWKATNVFPKHILELKACDQSKQARKKLSQYNKELFNVLCKFFIKVESMWRCRIKVTPADFTVVGRLPESLL